MDSLLLILPLLFVTALLYSSVGHGGASGYLACMALVGISPLLMRPSALILNLFVSGIAFVSFYKAGFFRWRLLWPFAITSVPASYIGARLDINPTVYKIILGICLIIAVARILYKSKDSETLRNLNISFALILGLILGLISGMIGIGGGIILSPLLIVFRWAPVKEASAVSAIFIFLNSLSGLVGLFQKGFSFEPKIAVWITVAVIGGIIGSYLGSRKFSITGLKYVLASVLCFAAFKLLIF
jgi:uncharacterized membrane protein YfcA